MALGDRNRLRGKPAGAVPKPAAATPSVKAAAPLLEAPARKAEKAPAPKAEHAPAAKVSPPPRHKPEAAPKVVVEEPAASDSGEVTVQRTAHAKSETTVQVRHALAEPVREEGTQALSVSEMELVSSAIEAPVQKTSAAIEAPQASEPATVAASPAPILATRPKTLRFSGVGDTESIGELKFQLKEILSGEMINVIISGGQSESLDTLRKGQESTVMYSLKDGTRVSVAMTYTGLNMAGTAWQVDATVKGLKAANISDVLAAALKSTKESAPSKLAFAPSI
ncbi:MAG: hypothetical protein ACOY58_00910, partial [Candidatus Micrarchaeota archaeon]